MTDNAAIVIDLDRQRMKAMETKDFAFLEKVLGDDLVYIHSSARVQTKQSLLESMKTGTVVYAALEPSDVKAQDLGEAVVLTGLARAEGEANGLPLSFTVRFINMYACRGNGWQMVAWQSTRKA